MKSTIKFIKLLVSAMLWITLVSCGGAGSTGARDPSTDPTGKISVYIGSTAYLRCGSKEVSVTLDGVAIGTIYFLPAYLEAQKACGKFDVPGQQTRNVSFGVHAVSATNSSGTCTWAGVTTKEVTKDACLIVELP